MAKNPFGNFFDVFRNTKPHILKYGTIQQEPEPGVLEINVSEIDNSPPQKTTWWKKRSFNVKPVGRRSSRNDEELEYSRQNSPAPSTPNYLDRFSPLSPSSVSPSTEPNVTMGSIQLFEHGRSRNFFQQFGQDLIGALVTAILVSANCVAFAYSVFAANDRLMETLSTGINMTIAGVIISGLAVAAFSRVPWGVMGPDLFVIPFLYNMVQNLYQNMSADSPDDTLTLENFSDNCIIMFCISTLACGFGLIICSSQYVRLADFIPFVVMCGLFTGIGFRLLQVGYLLCTDDFNGLSQFWLSLFLGLLDATLRDFGLLGCRDLLVLVAPILFFIVLHFAGISMETATNAGWLFDTSDIRLQHYNAWQNFQNGFSNVNLGIIIKSCSLHTTLMTILVVMKVSLIFRHSSQTLGAEVNHKKEMRVAGLCDILSAFSAGFPTYLDQSATVFLRWIGASWRTPGLLTVVIMFFLYWYDNSLLIFLPKFVFSGRLFSQGLKWFVTWSIYPIHKLSWMEWSVIPFISALTWFYGLPVSMTVGACITLVLFVYTHYTAGCVKTEATGLILRSSVERDNQSLEFLNKHGELIHILFLQGYIFYGNAQKMYRIIRHVFHFQSYDSSPNKPESPLENYQVCPVPKILILDCPFILGVDAAAVDVFKKVFKTCGENGCVLFFSGASPTVKKYLVSGGLKGKVSEVRFVQDFDEALQLAEDKLLASLASKIKHEARVGIANVSNEQGFLNCLKQIAIMYDCNTSGMESLLRFIKTICLKPGETISCENSLLGEELQNKQSGIFFLELGFVILRGIYEKIKMQKLAMYGKRRESLSSSKKNMCLMRFGPGWVIGSLELASGEPDLGIYSAETDCRVHFLSMDAYEILKEQEPKVVFKLLELTARMVATRCDELKGQVSNMIECIYRAPSAKKKPSVIVHTALRKRIRLHRGMSI